MSEPIVDKVAFLRHQLQQCAGYTADGIRKARTDALNYYLQRPRGDEVTGRSTVVSGDLSASVEANSAQIGEAFSSDDIVEFDSLGLEDEDQAKLETDAVVHFVMKANPGAQQIKSSAKDALLLRNGFFKCWVDRFEQSTTRTFDNVAPEVVEGVLARIRNAIAKVKSYVGRVLRIKATQTHLRFRAYAIAPENFFYPQSWDDFDLQEIPFCAELHYGMRSELVRMGYDKTAVAELKAVGSPRNREDSNARDPGFTTQASSQNLDKSLDLIEWFECYPLTDVDGDGVAERRRMTFIDTDGVVLGDDPATLVPYAAGAVFIMPHRLTGVSLYDKLRAIQDERTGLKRALYDNVNAVTKNRVAYLDGKVNVDDVGDGRVNGAIRVKASAGVEDVRMAVMPFAVPDNSANILANLEALKRERAELGGSALDMQSAQTQLGDIRGSQGVDRAFSVMEQLAALMTKNFADTLVRNLFLLAHATLRENYDQPLNLKINGKWKSTNPSQWAPRNRITVKPGMSPGERARIADTFRQMLADQVQLSQLGMDEVLVTAQGFYRTLMQWARTKGVSNPEQYYRDPDSDAAKQALDTKSKAAQDDAAKRQALMNRAIGTKETEVALDKYKHDSQLEHDYWADNLKSEEKEAEIVGHATTELLKAREKPDGTVPEGAARRGSGAQEEPAASEAA